MLFVCRRSLSASVMRRDLEIMEKLLSKIIFEQKAAGKDSNLSDADHDIKDNSRNEAGDSNVI